ncbi:hypothetical protein [Verminephrobacter eiseniae]|uniref:hypothetical protein n=1 Tax=Verminephrobacter eiseniae TaxID=364317 RepID=UPI002237623B|nr:hypothetical protein [Verminephrobacter eiseniae]MCW5238067.1 hypothetical protein [Verminephrobacter eiseniae]
MKPSPVQLVQLMFKHVKVELDPAHLPEEIPNPLTSVFTFDGVSLQSEVGIGEADPNHERGTMFFVELRVAVDNVPNPDTADQKYAPYKIDVVIEGVVLIPRGTEQLGDPEDLAAVNGASMLWSAVREQVLTITSRMRAGPVVLPSVHFHDLKKQPEASKVSAAPKTGAKNVRRSKSE